MSSASGAWRGGGHPGAEGRAEHLTDLSDERGVGAALRLPDDEQAVEPPQPLADVVAEIHEPLALPTPPGPVFRYGSITEAMGATVGGRDRTVSAGEPIRCGPAPTAAQGAASPETAPPAPDCRFRRSSGVV